MFSFSLIFKQKQKRHLAKSILILIPVFGLHFIFFAWFPYAKLMNIKLSSCLEICIVYIEIFFNAFQVWNLIIIIIVIIIITTVVFILLFFI